MSSATMTDTMPELAGHALLARLAASEVEAITEAYESHQVAVRAFAQRLLGDHEAAEDLVQDVFVSLPTAARRFRGDCTLRTFLVSIAVNRSKNHVRAAARRRAALARLAREPMTAEVESPQRTLERQELGARLMNALDELPLEQRVAVVLSDVEERTSAEIATITAVPEATVRTRLFHGRRKLREYLGVSDGE